MKIALVTPYDYPYPGGVTEHIAGLDREFRARGYETRIIAASTRDELEGNVIKVSGAIAPIRFNGSVSRVAFSPRIYHRVKRILREHRFDIVHLQEPVVPLLGHAVLRYSQAINVGTFHAYGDSGAIYDVARPLAAHVLERLHGRIFVSEAVRDFIIKYLPGEYVIIPNGIDFARFADPRVEPIARFDDGRPNILFVGRLDERKGFRFLLEAFARVKNEIPEARLIVVGAYSKEERAPFVRFAHAHRVRSVHFVGWVETRELVRYYRTATIFCAPSTGLESFGVVLLEAMASGAPVVASDIEGYHALLEKCATGVIVPPADAPQLARALLDLIRAPERRQVLSVEGRRAAREYDWSLVAGRVLDYYHYLIAERERTSAADELKRARKPIISPVALRAR